MASFFTIATTDCASSARFTVDISTTDLEIFLMSCHVMKCSLCAMLLNCVSLLDLQHHSIYLGVPKQPLYLQRKLSQVLSTVQCQEFSLLPLPLPAFVKQCLWHHLARGCMAFRIDLESDWYVHSHTIRWLCRVDKILHWSWRDKLFPFVFAFLVPLVFAVFFVCFVTSTADKVQGLTLYNYSGNYIKL